MPAASTWARLEFQGAPMGLPQPDARPRREFPPGEVSLKLYTVRQTSLPPMITHHRREIKSRQASKSAQSRSRSTWRTRDWRREDRRLRRPRRCSSTWREQGRAPAPRRRRRDLAGAKDADSPMSIGGAAAKTSRLTAGGGGARRRAGAGARGGRRQRVVQAREARRRLRHAPPLGDQPVRRRRGGRGRGRGKGGRGLLGPKMEGRGGQLWGWLYTEGDGDDDDDGE